MRTRIKICGVRTVEDAVLAARAGADAVGIIQVPTAKRFVPAETAAEIAGALPAFITPVLVFADSPVAEIVAACELTGVRTVQLHGHERVAVALELHAAIGATIIRRCEIGLSLRTELDHWSLLNRNVLAGVLLEGPGRGGTGVPSDWDALEWTLNSLDRNALPPIILAGGLLPNNVAAVIQRFRPHAVDTSSGVESPATPLKKDARLIEAFLDAARHADQAIPIPAPLDDLE